MTLTRYSGEVSSLTGPSAVLLSVEPSPTWGLVPPPDQVFLDHVVNNRSNQIWSHRTELSCRENLHVESGKTCPRAEPSIDNGPFHVAPPVHACDLLRKVAGKAKLKGKAEFSWQNQPECSWLIRHSFHPGVGKDVTHQSLITLL